jgi:maleate isomerase
MAEQVGALGAEAILILCTNLGGAPLVQRIECKLQLPVLDSDVFGLLGGLRSISVDFSNLSLAGRVRRWKWW